VPGDLDRAGGGHRDDRELVTDDPAPHPGVDVSGRGGVTHRPEPHRLVVIDQPLLTQRRRVRIGRQHMQMRLLQCQPVNRGHPGLAVHPGVDVIAPLITGRDEFAERRVGAAQVRIRRHQVGLGNLDRRFHTTFRLGVERLARMHGAAVVPSGCHDHRVAHRNPGHMLHGDRLRVVAQQIRRGAADTPQRRVQARDQCPQRLIPGRDHDPKPRPRQPRTEQTRPTAVHARALAPFELQPQTGLGHPRPVGTPPTGPPRALFAAATARRVVRSVPANPIATRRS
jgi:hypothetical protein